LDLDRIPALEVAGALLSPVDDLGDIFSTKNSSHIRNGHLEEDNILTRPNENSLKLLHALLISSYLFTKEGTGITIRQAAELAFQQQEFEQREHFKKLISVHNGRGVKSDDKYWTRTRNEILWMRNWGYDEPDGIGTDLGRGVFGRLSKEELEVALLKVLVSNNR
jgi:hypothetical protein